MRTLTPLQSIHTHKTKEAHIKAWPIKDLLVEWKDSIFQEDTVGNPKQAIFKK